MNFYIKPQEGGSQTRCDQVLTSSLNQYKQYYGCFDVHDVLVDMNQFVQVEEESIRAADVFEENKLNYNINQKRRKMKSSYYALSSILPDHYHAKRSKMKCCDPMSLDSALDYIPRLQTEVEMLKQRKEHLFSVIEKKHNAIEDVISSMDPAPTVSVTKASEQEMIVQICFPSIEQSHLTSALLTVIEQEGHSVSTCETVSVGNSVSYSLHLHTRKGLHATADPGELKGKISSWFPGMKSSSAT